MKWKEQLRKEWEEHWESEETVETEIDELEGGKEWKEGLDGTLAASAYSQEDYSSTRCHRLPARPQRSSLNGDTQHGHTYTSLWMFPRCILVSISPVSLSLFFSSSTVLFSSFDFLSYNFPSLFPASLLSLSIFITPPILAAVREEATDR